MLSAATRINVSFDPNNTRNNVRRLQYHATDHVSRYGTPFHVKGNANGLSVYSSPKVNEPLARNTMILPDGVAVFGTGSFLSNLHDKFNAEYPFQYAKIHLHNKTLAASDGAEFLAEKKGMLEKNKVELTLESALNFMQESERKIAKVEDHLCGKTAKDVANTLYYKYTGDLAKRGYLRMAWSQMRQYANSSLAACAVKMGVRWVLEINEFEEGAWGAKGDFAKMSEEEIIETAQKFRKWMATMIPRINADPIDVLTNLKKYENEAPEISFFKKNKEGVMVEVTAKAIAGNCITSYVAIGLLQNEFKNSSEIAQTLWKSIEKDMEGFENAGTYEMFRDTWIKNKGLPAVVGPVDGIDIDGEFTTDGTLVDFIQAAKRSRTDSV